MIREVIARLYACRLRLLCVLLISYFYIFYFFPSFYTSVRAAYGFTLVGSVLCLLLICLFLCLYIFLSFIPLYVLLTALHLRVAFFLAAYLFVSLLIDFPKLYTFVRASYGFTLVSIAFCLQLICLFFGLIDFPALLNICTCHLLDVLYLL